MKETLVVNLIGGQGTGKSTTMAGVFEKLKLEGYDCEMVTEYAKDLVWENRSDTFKDELYIFAKQNHRLFRCNGKVDIIITDRPLIMTIAYNEYYGKKDDEWNKSLNDLVLNTFNSYKNLNIFLKRVKPYHQNGRNESFEEAKNFDKLFLELLEKTNQPYTIVDADDNASKIISNIIKE